MSFLINPYAFAAAAAYDPDAADYISRVETADAQSLETVVKDLINDLFVGVKADGNFGALKACCIMAGARTLAGALTPLLSSMPAPTSYNFVAGDYGRKTGLRGSRNDLKYLDSNRNNNADPQNSKHLSVYATELDSGNTNPPFIAAAGSGNRSFINAANSGGFVRPQTSLNDPVPVNTTDVNITAPCFIGVNRNVSTEYTLRRMGSDVTIAQPSGLPSDAIITLFRRIGGSPTEYASHGIAFYSIGESLDLALLDARVSTFMSSLAALTL